MDFSFTYIWSNLMIGCLGMGYFLYGKKAQRPWPLIAGLLMCIYPFFIYDIILLWLITLAICVGVYLLRQRSDF